MTNPPDAKWLATHVYHETPNIPPSVVFEGQIWCCGDCPHYWEDRIRCCHPGSLFSNELFVAEVLRIDAPPFPPACPWFKHSTAGVLRDLPERMKRDNPEAHDNLVKALRRATQDFGGEEGEE